MTRPTWPADPSPDEAQPDSQQADSAPPSAPPRPTFTPRHQAPDSRPRRLGPCRPRRQRHRCGQECRRRMAGGPASFTPRSTAAPTPHTVPPGRDDQRGDDQRGDDQRADAPGGPGTVTGGLVTGGTATRGYGPRSRHARDSSRRHRMPAAGRRTRRLPRSSPLPGSRRSRPTPRPPGSSTYPGPGQARMRQGWRRTAIPVLTSRAPPG